MVESCEVVITLINQPPNVGGCHDLHACGRRRYRGGSGVSRDAVLPLGVLLDYLTHTHTSDALSEETPCNVVSSIQNMTSPTTYCVMYTSMQGTADTAFYKSQLIMAAQAWDVCLC